MNRNVWDSAEAELTKIADEEIKIKAAIPPIDVQRIGRVKSLLQKVLRNLRIVRTARVVTGTVLN